MDAGFWSAAPRAARARYRNKSLQGDLQQKVYQLLKNKEQVLKERRELEEQIAGLRQKNVSLIQMDQSLRQSLNNRPLPATNNLSPFMLPSASPTITPLANTENLSLARLANLLRPTQPDEELQQRNQLLQLTLRMLQAQDANLLNTSLRGLGGGSLPRDN